ncbi:alpha/beta hydrolase [Nocardioides nanhaiensis]|uniref:alpha/beta hydrolase family protein n=1 Tax=Nocardioides nanhaiensis TaxID=1476871 RepID=UPI0031EA6603
MTALLGSLAVALTLGAAPAAPVDPAGPPAPGTSARVAGVDDLAAMAAAYGRITGPGGQLRNPAYLPALVQATSALTVAQLVAQAATPSRLALTAGNVVPGWNVGNPLRAGWHGTRGLARRVAFTNRYGALLQGTVHRPLPGARDPYTGQRLRPPFPGVVLTPGSVQGSEGMYSWLAQDLAERGYVVLTFDVQGQGRGETLPHTTSNALPFCNPFAAPRDGEQLGCPGVPFQQLANFVVGTEDAVDFFTSTAALPYRNPGSAGARIDTHNPFARWLDRRRDPRAAAGRPMRLAIIGHSLGAQAVSRVQGTDRRVATVVALDKLAGGDGDPAVRPRVPALAVQSEYGFTVTPAALSGGSSLVPTPTPAGPDPRRERSAGFDRWAAAGVDSLLVVPRSSTHLEYTDIPLVLPASRYGQAVTSVYVQRWLDLQLKHRGSPRALLAPRLRYLEPRGSGRWAPVTLRAGDQLSTRYCSAYRLTDRRGRVATEGDLMGAGC